MSESEWTPTTDEVRQGWIFAGETSREEDRAAFDRWLAAEKAAVWDAAIAYATNPYRREVTP